MTPSLEGPITTGAIERPVSVKQVDLAAHGYVEEEFFLSGVAHSYEAVGEHGTDGRWDVTADGSEEYRTRIVVRRPADRERFNGIVAVEWLNVSGGVEADPDWTYLGDELRREGYAYVAATVQRLGVHGGAGLVDPMGPPGGGLVGTNPERYGSLVHPGDRFAFDVYTDIATALRSSDIALGPLEAEHVVAVGESQSAYYLTTYINAFHPAARQYDAFFVHSRGGTAAPVGPGPVIDNPDIVLGARIRTDVDVPVFIFEAETDLEDRLDYSPARQEDTDRIRCWEVAGTAHADAYLVGPFADALGCVGRVNEGPQHVVVKAAFHALNRWMVDGSPPPSAPPLQLEPDRPPRVVRDIHGNALGGVRTPSVDVPVAALSGSPAPDSSILCSLFGSTTPFDQPTLDTLYPTRAAYETAFESSLDRAITAGFVLAADRATYLEESLAIVADWST